MSPAGTGRRGLARRARGCLVALAATLATVAVLGFVFGPVIQFADVLVGT